MRLILQRNFAIAKKLREKLHRQNLFMKEAYIKLHNNTRSIVEEILEMIRTKLTEVENAEN